MGNAVQGIQVLHHHHLPQRSGAVQRLGMELPEQAVQRVPGSGFRQGNPRYVVGLVEMRILYPVRLVEFQNQGVDPAAQDREQVMGDRLEVVLQRDCQALRSPLTAGFVKHHRADVHGNSGQLPFDHQVVEAAELLHAEFSFTLIAPEGCPQLSHTDL